MAYRLTGNETIEAVRCSFSDIPADLKPTFDYWDDLRGDRFAPTWNDFDLLKLPLQALPTTHVMDWLPEQDEFRFRFYGSSYAVIHGVDLTGKSLMEMPSKSLAEFMYGEYLSVVQGREQTLVTYGVRDGDEFVEIERCLRLPLSDDGVSVTGLVALGLVAVDILDVEDIIEDLGGKKVGFKSDIAEHD